MSLGIDDIRAAAQRLSGHVLETPCLVSRTLGELAGCKVFLKFENHQFTASFKERGALNKIAQLTPAERARGVLAVSAGNHAQGVAYHAQRLGIPATIVMPRFAPAVKVERTRGFGAAVVLEGDTFDDARMRGMALAAERGLTLVHPYDDLAVIAGQGTIGLEMLAQQPAIDVLVVAVGGGGLISGIATAARATNQDIEIVGAEAALYPSFWNALNNRHRTIGGATLAEGIAVKNVGSLTLPIVRELVSDVVLVDEAHLERAVNVFLTRQKTIAEGAGAAGLAAMLAQPERFRGHKVGLVLCGGNIDPRILAAIMVRELQRDSRIVSFRLTIPDRPGILGQIATRLGQLGANILEVDHKRMFLDVPAKGAKLDATVETRDADHADAIFAALEADGYQPLRIDAGDAME